MHIATHGRPFWRGTLGPRHLNARGHSGRARPAVPEKTVQIRLRSSGERAAREYVKDQGGLIFTARDLRGRDGAGLAGVIYPDTGSVLGRYRHSSSDSARSIAWYLAFATRDPALQSRGKDQFPGADSAPRTGPTGISSAWNACWRLHPPMTTPNSPVTQLPLSSGLIERSNRQSFQGVRPRTMSLLQSDTQLNRHSYYEASVQCGSPVRPCRAT